MSRSSSLRQSLRLSPDDSLEVLSVEPSGDCFYDCIYALMSRTDTSQFSDSSLCLHAQTSIPSPQAMREYVADRYSQEQFDLYKMYAAAGVEEYSHMSTNGAPQNLQELKDFAKRSGKQYGPGQCLWADEFSLRTISNGLHLSILIIDDQAQRERGRGSCSAKRKRGNAASIQADGRFVSLENYKRATILHRTRREHFNCVIINGCSVFDRTNSPVSSLWPSHVVETQNDSNDKSEEKKLSSNSMKSAAGNIKTERGIIVNQQSIGKFYVGCAGFSNPSWVGNFYPKTIVGHNSDRQLSHYQEHFSTLEINSTFYGVPSESTVLKWKRLCSKTFRLVVKAPKGVTHEQDTLNSRALVHFLQRMQPLREILVCVLIQCPRTLDVNASQLERVKVNMQEEVEWYSGHLAFELRNRASFHDTNVRNFLNQNRWTLVVHPDSVERSTIGTSVSGRDADDLVQYEPQKLSQYASTCSVTSTIVYLRLHGTNDQHRCEYRSNQLKEISEKIHRWRTQGLDVYCFFLNDLEPASHVTYHKASMDQCEKWAAMPKNAKQLEKMVFCLSNEQIPGAPKRPKGSVLDYFAKK